MAVVGDVVVEAGSFMPTQEKSRPKSLLKCWTASPRPGPALPLSEAKKESVEEPDQWTVAGQLRNLRPMYRYAWPDGQAVYLNGITGEVVQYTTFAKRLAAHVSAIPHWIYYTPIRRNQPVWIKFMIYSSLIGTISAIVGMVAAVWMYSPKKKVSAGGASDRHSL